MNKNEINELKQEYESLSAKLTELTDEELEQVTGGSLVLLPWYPMMCPICFRMYDFSVDQHFVFRYEGDTGWPYVSVKCSRCGATYGYKNPKA